MQKSPRFRDPLSKIRNFFFFAQEREFFFWSRDILDYLYEFLWSQVIGILAQIPRRDCFALPCLDFKYFQMANLAMLDNNANAKISSTSFQLNYVLSSAGYVYQVLDLKSFTENCCAKETKNPQQYHQIRMQPNSLHLAAHLSKQSPMFHIRTQSTRARSNPRQRISH